MHRLTKITVALGMALAAIPGVAIAQDFRSPDARDSANQVTGRSGAGILNGRDLVSSGASDTARPAPAPDVNLQSPDAKSSSGVSTYEPGHTSLPAAPAAPVVVSAPSGFDWGDAGIGAAAMLALIALAGGTLLVATHRRREHRPPAAPA